MSDGIRSGVNWMRLFWSPSTVPSVSTRLVLARPGTPIRSAWPPDSTVISARSMTRSWPKMMAEVVSRTFVDLGADLLDTIDELGLGLGKCCHGVQFGSILVVGDYRAKGRGE